jgi:DNA-binding NarL/FixJ family response regulator
MGADIMAVIYLARHAHRNSAFARAKRCAVAGDDATLTSSTRLRESLAREGSLHHQLDELSQHNEVLSKLLGGAKDAARRIAGLTSREGEIMQRIVAGEPNKNIAVDLGISQRTVENHRASIMKKTGSKSLPALTRLALAIAWNGVPEPESTIPIATATVARPQSEPTFWEQRDGYPPEGK